MEKNKKKKKEAKKEANKDVIFSDYDIVIFNLRGLNEADIKESFADFDVLEVRIVQKDPNKPPIAFVTFRTSDALQRALQKKQFKTKNGKAFLVNRVKVSHPEKEKMKIKRIQKTVKIDEQKSLDFQIKGFSMDGIIDLAQTKLNFKFVIRNKSILPKRITYIGFSGTRTFFTCKVNLIRLPRDLPAYSNLELDISFEHQLKEPASCFTTLIVETDKQRYQHEFVFKVSSLDDIKLLARQGEYKEREDLVLPDLIIPAPALEKASKTHVHTKVETVYVVPLPLYEVPEHIKQKVMETDTFPDFFPWQAKDKWIQRLHELLWFEEVELEKRSHRFDLRSITVREFPLEEVLKDFKLDAQVVYSEIDVPGLADNRPSVLYNDFVIVWAVGATQVAYEGRVAKVKEKSILVQFHQDFHTTFKHDTLFNVRFRFDRLHLRTWHRAIDTIKLDILWPSSDSFTKEILQRLRPKDISWYDRDIPKNPEQANAIVSILNKTCGNAPYLLFGPFGTGKTKCLLEYVRQVLRLEKDCRILICAHSNSGTNKILEELMTTMEPSELFRLFSFNANPIQPTKVLQYTCRDPDRGVFVPPPMELLRSYRVILSTGDNAALLHGIGVGSKHFTHIVVDEAAEFSEPGICVPLCLASTKTTIVLAGDNKQTSPRIFSRIAKHHGLAKSLMERLASSPLYRLENKSPNPDLYANLVRNYRSHPNILQFLSKEFYENRLICQTREADYRALQPWSKRGTKKDFPFLFYALDNSKEDREADSPGYFNIDEAIAITSLVIDLLNEERKFGRNLRQQDICVLCASRKQTQKVRLLMRKHKLGAVDVGTTEALQGREFKAIFISTVRSSTNLLEFDRQHNIGFVADEKRFNTAISRAVALVVVVGNSRLLAQVPMWRNFIRYCSENKSYVNLMSGAVTGEEMIRELEEEEEDSRKKAEKEAKDAKIQAHLDQIRAKKVQSNKETKYVPVQSNPSNNEVSVSQKPHVNLPPTSHVAPNPFVAAIPSQSPATSTSFYSHNGNSNPPNNTGLPVPNATNYSRQPQQPQIIPLHIIESSHWMQGNGVGMGGVQTNLPTINEQQPIHASSTQAQMNGQGEEPWTSVDNTKSMTLSMFRDKDLIVAFKDKNLKGYPPLTVERHPTHQEALFVTFYAARMQVLEHRRNGFFIFEFFSMPQDPLLMSCFNLIPFTPTTPMNSSAGTPEILLSKIRLNVPEGYDCVTSPQNDRLVVALVPQGTVYFGAPSNNSL